MTGSPSSRPRNCPSSTARSPTTASRDARVTAPARTPAAAFSISAAFSSACRLGVEGDHRPQPRLHRARRDESGRLGRGADGLLGGEDDVLVVREHDRLRCGQRLDRGDDVRGGRVHGLPALDAGRSQALEEPAVPVAGTDGDDAARRVPRRSGSAPRAAAVWRCMFCTSTSSITPTAVASERAVPGSSVWRCTFTAPRPPTTSSESPISWSSASSESGIDLVALDEEGRAVAEPRELLVHGLERDRLEERRGLGQLLAADVRGDAADDLEQAGSAGVDDARLLEDVQLLGRPREGDLPGGEQRRGARPRPAGRRPRSPPRARRGSGRP